MAAVDVLVPTYRRPCALAVTLAGLVSQTLRGFRVVVSDQSDEPSWDSSPEVRAVVRVLEARGHRVDLCHHLPRRGMAEQRQFLLDRSTAPHALFLDDDVIVEPDVVERLHRTLVREGCGFVGSAVIGLSHRGDVRPEQEDIELWEGPVRPERVVPGSREWERYRLHWAANLFHVARRLGLGPGEERRYKVAWVGGCVMYRTDALRAVGGFRFWRDLPRVHAGEDVLAQLRVMARFGGCGILPSGAYHQELPTTVPHRDVDAPRVLR